MEANGEGGLELEKDGRMGTGAGWGGRNNTM